MTARTIIGPHNPHVSLPGSKHQRYVHLITRRCATKSLPGYYGKVKHSNGRLEVLEFSNSEEFNRIKRVIVSRISNIHRQTGGKHIGCDCPFCK